MAKPPCLGSAAVFGKPSLPFEGVKAFGPAFRFIDSSLPTTTMLNLMIVAGALLTLAGAPWALNQAALLFIFKPLTTLLIIAHAWPRGNDTPMLRCLVLAGLVLSLVGDIALLWPKEGFLPGLIAFLAAHVVYIVAFAREQRFAARPEAFALYALVAGGVLAMLWMHIPDALRVPVAAYVLALVTMAAQAAVVWLGARGSEHEARARWLAIGGALFVLSDALLATNKFATPLPLASLWILGSYWSAQWCIASWLKPAPALTTMATPREGAAG